MPYHTRPSVSGVVERIRTRQLGQRWYVRIPLTALAGGVLIAAAIVLAPIIIVLLAVDAIDVRRIGGPDMPPGAATDHNGGHP